jgi:hypothetical protein
MTTMIGIIASLLLAQDLTSAYQTFNKYGLVLYTAMTEALVRHANSR